MARTAVPLNTSLGSLGPLNRSYTAYPPPRTILSSRNAALFNQSARLRRWRIRCTCRAARLSISSDFIAPYLLPVLYPEGLTRELQ